MIGQFFPALVVVSTGFILAPGQSVVNVRATSAATEIANDVDWLQNEG